MLEPGIWSCPVMNIEVLAAQVVSRSVAGVTWPRGVRRFPPPRNDRLRHPAIFRAGTTETAAQGAGKSFPAAAGATVERSLDQALRGRSRLLSGAFASAQECGLPGFVYRAMDRALYRW